ncbi:NAD(P)/FAD-dependent oxidoreductase [Thermodesulfobacteriota bacterium]
MEEYDVIVVGGGPCGTSAARKAAEKGMKVVLIEEHAQIGLPEHCVGVLSATKTRFLEELVEEMEPRVVRHRVMARRIYAPSGRVAQTALDHTGACFIERNIFDLELARLATEAGAEIVVNTRVTGLIKEDGVVKGVNTSSNNLPEVRGKIVIAADGLRALFKGISKMEGLSRENQMIISGLKWHLGGVKDVEPGILEFHLGSLCDRGFVTVVGMENGCCMTDIVSQSDFDKIRAGNWALSKKIKDCGVLRVTGFSHPIPMGIMLPKKVKDGLILAGDAAGFISIDEAVSSGRSAAEVAAEAIKAGDVSEGKLAVYEDHCQKLEEEKEWYTNQFHSLERFFGLPDDEIEEKFRESEPDII